MATPAAGRPARGPACGRGRARSAGRPRVARAPTRPRRRTAPAVRGIVAPARTARLRRSGGRGRLRLGLRLASASASSRSRASIAALRRRRSRPRTSTVTEMLAALSVAPAAMSAVAASASHAPASIWSPAALGGGSMICTSTTKRAAKAITGTARCMAATAVRPRRDRRSRRPRAGGRPLEPAPGVAARVVPVDEQAHEQQHGAKGDESGTGIESLAQDLESSERSGSSLSEADAAARRRRWWRPCAMPGGARPCCPAPESERLHP